jgi:hypothetical protein
MEPQNPKEPKKPNTVIISPYPYEQKPDTTNISFLEDALIQNKGKLLVGLVHEGMYGPMKGMHALVQPLNIEAFHNYMNALTKENKSVYLRQIQEELISKFWEKSQLVVRVMVLPIELIEQYNLQPQTVNSGISFNKLMLEKLKRVPNFSQNQWYFRKGEIK